MQLWRRGVSMLAGLALGMGVVHAGTVTVRFVDPQTFFDAIDLPEPGATPTLSGIADHLRRLGQKHLPPEQVLSIDVLDIDLIGKLRPSRHAGFVRVATSPADWPRVTLRYRLEANGRLISSGRESVADLGFAGRIEPPAVDNLRYEKRMLSNWFRDRFAAR